MVELELDQNRFNKPIRETLVEYCDAHILSMAAASKAGWHINKQYGLIKPFRIVVIRYCR